MNITSPLVLPSGTKGIPFRTYRLSKQITYLTFLLFLLVILVGVFCSML